MRLGILSKVSCFAEAKVCLLLCAEIALFMSMLKRIFIIFSVCCVCACMDVNGAGKYPSSSYPASYPSSYPSGSYGGYGTTRSSGYCAHYDRYGRCDDNSYRERQRELERQERERERWEDEMRERELERLRRENHEHEMQERRRENRPYQGSIGQGHKPPIIEQRPNREDVIHPNCPAGTVYTGSTCKITDSSLKKPGGDGNINPCPKGMWVSGGKCVK